MTVAIKFNWEDNDLNDGLSQMDKKALAAVKMYATTKAPVLTSKMQIDRPWTDRSNMAKTRLSTSVSTVGDSVVRLTLAHGVWYGIYLELAHGRKYAIIKPTIDKESPGIMKDMNRLFSSIEIR